MGSNSFQIINACANAHSHVDTHDILVHSHTEFWGNADVFKHRECSGMEGL